MSDLFHGQVVDTLKKINENFDNYNLIKAGLIKLSRLYKDNSKVITFPVSLPLSAELIYKFESLDRGDPRLCLLEEFQQKHEKIKDRRIEYFPTHTFSSGEELEALISNTMRINGFTRRKHSALDRQSRILTFGSCFANHLHKKLYDLSFDSTSIGVSDSINNPVYHSRAIADKYLYSRELRRYIDSGDGLVKDQVVNLGQDNDINHLRRVDGCWTSNYLSDFYAVLKKEIIRSDFIIFTIGSAYLRGNKSFSTIKDIVESIGRFVDFVASSKKAKTIVLTLSPVPLDGIWGGLKTNEISAIEADCYSKSICRVAIQEFLELWEVSLKHSFSHISLDYYPSFEMARWLAPLQSGKVWSDTRHLDDSIIDSIMSRFIAMYCG